MDSTCDFRQVGWVGLGLWEVREPRLAPTGLQCGGLRIEAEYRAVSSVHRTGP